MRRLLGAAAAALALVATLPAQGSRHELGLRLRAFERHLADEQDPDRRDRAFVELERAVQAFFRLDMARVGAAIDAADLALHGREAPALERFARSLQLRLSGRLVDAASAQVTIDVRPLYELEDEPDTAGLALVFRPHADAKWQRRELGELPAEFELELRDLSVGDHEFAWRIENGDAVLASRSMAFAAASELERRLELVHAAAKTARKMRPPSIESSSLVTLSNLLRTTQRRAAYETELRGGELLAEAERLLAWLDDSRDRQLYDGGRPGSFRLSVPVEGATVATRLFAPKVDEGERPLVVALHGAGGSENLFFDGYGDGLCVELARERGWFVVSPRCGMRGIDAVGLVDALAKRYPIDRDRVFVVGHSMGAGQAMANVSREPTRFRAVAPIAGGGRVGKAVGFDALPFFVCAGERDFGLQGAKRLHRAIERAGADAQWRVYPSVEHLAIVQVALPDVFAFFDAHVR